MVKKIKIKGAIIPNDYKWAYDWFEMDSTCPNDVSKVLDTLNGEEIEIEINSGGGDVYSGSEIYTALKGHKGKKIVKIVGIAASAASIIAMAGDKILISPTAQIMIHNVRSGAEGDYRDLGHASDILKNYNKSIANAYRLKTGLSEKELLDLMNKESWFNAQQALEYKFVDEIMFQEESRMVASYNNMIPIEVINKIRSTVKGPINPESGESDILMSKYNYLKLKGECKDEF